MIASDHAHMKRFLTKVRTKTETGFLGFNEDYCTFKRSLALHADYLTQVHHQIEDLLFKQLLKVWPSILPTLDHLSREHGELEGLLKEWLLPEQGATEPTQARIELEMRHVRNYVDQKLAHISKEENRVLSSIHNVFTAADWVIVDRRAEEIYVTAMDGKCH